MQRQKAAKQLTRNIDHPNFKNVNFEEAENFLRNENLDIGELIIRPSSKGNRHLTITWKVFRDVFQHIGFFFFFFFFFFFNI